jgi:hypothetical protein
MGFILAAVAQSNDSSAQNQARSRSVNQAQRQEWPCRDDIRERTGSVMRISQGVTAANATSKVQPDAAGVVLTGSDNAFVQIVIDPDGNVACARDLAIPEATLSVELRSRALEAAKHWKFKPYLLNGNPVFVDGVLWFSFANQ